MQLLVNMGGYVNWDTTRRVVVSSPTFCTGQGDFGIGAEYQALCAGCGRTLPTALMHLDHILSQARYTIRSGNLSIKLLDSNPPHNESTTLAAHMEGATVTISQLGSGGPTRRQAALHAARATPYQAPRVGVKTVLHTADCWKNDLENLQFLCMCCNTAKGEREFDLHFPDKAPRPLLR